MTKRPTPNRLMKTKKMLNRIRRNHHVRIGECLPTILLMMSRQPQRKNKPKPKQIMVNMKKVYETCSRRLTMLNRRTAR